MVERLKRDASRTGPRTTGYETRAETERRLQTEFRMTGAEAALAAALANGSRLSEYADDRGVSLSTVRTQLKKCFRKTATSRQADLIRLILIGVPSAGE